MDLSQLREQLRKGIEGATPGPWSAGHLADPQHTCNCAHVFGNDDRMGAVATIHVHKDHDDDNPPVEEATANLKHIAACSPGNISALLDALDRAEANLQTDISLRQSIAKDAGELRDQIVSLRAELTEAKRWEQVWREEVTSTARVFGDLMLAPPDGGGVKLHEGAQRLKEEVRVLEANAREERRMYEAQLAALTASRDELVAKMEDARGDLLDADELLRAAIAKAKGDAAPAGEKP